MPQYPKKVTRTQANIQRALEDLDINVPYYDCRLVGNRLEFHLYGGRVLSWPPVQQKAQEKAQDDAPAGDLVAAGKPQKPAPKRPPRKGG
jgi:hypothetical protein